MSTWQLALIIWIMAGITLAGTFVVAVLLVPQLQSHMAIALPTAAAAGFVVAFFASLVIARRMLPGRS
jgi:hypothetical protein